MCTILMNSMRWSIFKILYTHNSEAHRRMPCHWVFIDFAEVYNNLSSSEYYHYPFIIRYLEC